MIYVRAGYPAPRRRQNGPDGHPAPAGPDPPAAGQVLDDGEATPAKRGDGRTFGTRPGRSPAVTHRYPQRAAGQRPGHPDHAARQRAGMPDRVAQQLAQDQGRIADRGGHHAGFAQVGGEPPTSGRDTGRRVREQDDARCTHLPVPRPITGLTEPDMPRDFTPETPICPACITMHRRLPMPLPNGVFKIH